MKIRWVLSFFGLAFCCYCFLMWLVAWSTAEETFVSNAETKYIAYEWADGNTGTPGHAVNSSAESLDPRPGSDGRQYTRPNTRAGPSRGPLP